MYPLLFQKKNKVIASFYLIIIPLSSEVFILRWIFLNVLMFSAIIVPIFHFRENFLSLSPFFCEEFSLNAFPCLYHSIRRLVRCYYHLCVRINETSFLHYFFRNKAFTLLHLFWMTWMHSDTLTVRSHVSGWLKRNKNTMFYCVCAMRM